MSPSVPLRATLRGRVFPSPVNVDWFALTTVTAMVLFFALYPLFIARNSPRHWTFKLYGHISLNDSLTILLSLEAFLLIWVWLEMPRRRRAESALRRMYSIQRAISQASGRIVSMKTERLDQGLDQELRALREVLGVDRVSCFQVNEDGMRCLRVHASCGTEGDAAEQDFSSSELPWISDAISQSERILVKRLQDLPPHANVDRTFLELHGIKSIAVIPAEGGHGTRSALVLTSLSKEIKWHEETLAQLSVLASVFASAQARKAALDAGNASESRFRHLFDDSPLGIALLDLSGQVRTTNQALATLLGYSNEELKSKNILDVVCPDDVAKTWLHLQQLCAGARRITHTEKRLSRRDQSVIWGRMTISLVRAVTAEPASMLVIIENVTETIKAREQLERSRRVLNLALQSSQTTVWEYDPHAGTIEWLNRNALHDSENRTRVPSSFAKVLEQVVPEDQESLRGLAAEVLQSGGDFSTEFRTIGKDGIHWLLGKGELLRSDRDSRPKLIGVTVDISEIKRAQVQLQELAKRLMEAQEDERRRISRELHDDIGQRVALLAMELDLLQKAVPNEPRLQERVERLRASAGELGTDLHALSHALHSSKLKHLGLEAALRELCGRVRDRASLAVELNCSGDTRSLPYDEALALFRITQEALNNVIRHSRANSARVWLQCTDSQVELVISDNGCGFDYKMESGGIGLLGMRERLRAVDGEFRISSGPNCGTEIHASVPITPRVRGAARHAAVTL
jgi:PAS domain S-box-containing protein